jgi:glycosyltransferase involved in cell wall biosynthesis
MDQPTDRPRVSKEPISVLLPAFNQAAGLDPIVENWLRALRRLERPVELIIIDDASTDDTGTVADKLAARHPEVRVLRHDARRGFGACLRTGLAAARHPLVFYAACDYPYPPADIPKLLEVIDTLDLVSGCRTEPVPAWLRRLGAAYRLLVRVVFGIAPEPRPGWRGWRAWRRGVRLRLLFGVRLWDPYSAFKLFRRSVLDRLPIQSDGDFVHAELMAKANFLGCYMAEVPIGRLPGTFRGVAESPPAAEARRVFRRPVFAPPPAEPAVSTADGSGLTDAPVSTPIEK